MAAKSAVAWNPRRAVQSRAEARARGAHRAQDAEALAVRRGRTVCDVWNGARCPSIIICVLSPYPSMPARSTGAQTGTGAKRAECIDAAAPPVRSVCIVHPSDVWIVPLRPLSPIQPPTDPARMTGPSFRPAQGTIEIIASHSRVLPPYSLKLVAAAFS